MDKFISTYETNVGPLNGAKVVARAWTDAEYKRRLLADGTAAIKELGFAGPQGEHIVVVENTADRHNVVVCTLCSCYPWPVLGTAAVLVQGPGLSGPRRQASRAWSSPRWGSTSPPMSRSSSGTRAARCVGSCCPSGRRAPSDLPEEELVALVTRDAMVGVAKVHAPGTEAA